MGKINLYLCCCCLVAQQNIQVLTILGYTQLSKEGTAIHWPAYILNAPVHIVRWAPLKLLEREKVLKFFLPSTSFDCFYMFTQREKKITKAEWEVLHLLCSRISNTQGQSLGKRWCGNIACQHEGMVKVWVPSRQWAHQILSVRVAAAANSGGLVSCLISHKNSVQTTSSKHNDFLLSLFHNSLTKEFTVRGASSSLVGQEVKKGMNPSHLSTTSSFFSKLIQLYLKPMQMLRLNVDAVGSSLHVGEASEEERKKEIFGVKQGAEIRLNKHTDAETWEERSRPNRSHSTLPQIRQKRRHSSSFTAILSNFQAGQSQQGHGRSSASCCPSIQGLSPPE